MLQLSYEVKIGNTTYTGGSQSRLLTLRVDASLNIPINSCLITLTTPTDLSIAINDPVSIELGYAKDLTLVFSGVVSSINLGFDSTQIEIYSKFQALTIARFNLVYEKSDAGDIVKDVAQSRLKLKVGKIENGINFPVYILGDRQTVDQHLRTLANQCGYDFYADNQDQVVFAKYQANTIHEFKYGVNILAYQLADTTAQVVGVQVYGESPASQGQGDQAYSWLTKKDVKGAAGKQSGIVERLFEPTARSQDIANKIATSILAAKAHKKRGIVKVIGEPKVKLGDGIKISLLPVASQNGTFKVTGVTHILSQTKGFFTTINWEER